MTGTPQAIASRPTRPRLSAKLVVNAKISLEAIISLIIPPPRAVKKELKTTPNKSSSFLTPIIYPLMLKAIIPKISAISKIFNPLGMRNCNSNCISNVKGFDFPFKGQQAAAKAAG